MMTFKIAISQQQKSSKKRKKTGSFSLIERVILSAGAMLIFSVSFQLTKCPKALVMGLT